MPLATVEFARPIALVLLLILVPITMWELRVHRRDLDHRLASTALRALALLFLILTLARPVIVEEGPQPVTVIAVDLSESMAGPAAIQATLDAAVAEVPEEHELRVVVFAGTPSVLRPTGNDPRALPRLQSVVPNSGGSDIEAALTLSSGLVADGREGHVVVITDGRESRGCMLDATARLASRGISISVIDGGETTGAPVLLPIHMPAARPVGAVIEIVVQVEAPEGEDVHVTARGVEPAVAQVSVDLQRAGGLLTGSFRHEVPTAGLNTLEVRMTDAAGKILSGGVRSLAFHGRRPRRVLLIEDADAHSVAAELAGLISPGMTVERLAAQDLEEGFDFSRADVLMMGNVPARALSPAAQEYIAEAVRSGLGLLLTAGQRSLGPGGYAGTPLASILPVRFVQNEERRDPSATLVIIIDTSGSMSGVRMQLAKEVARLALKRLKPHDKAGIVEFHGAKRWAAPIQAASHSVEIQRALNRLNAGGGTVILPAIRESYYAMLNVRTRTRHLLVITDGGVEDGDFEGIVRKMADHGMTLSSVLVGPGSHSQFLMSLAQWGHGRFYQAADRFNLPEVIVKQPQSSMLAPFVEGDLAVRPAALSWIGSELALGSGDTLSGLVEVQARATANVLLADGQERPVLCRWRYGLGLVATWTSEVAGPWTGRLLQSPEYSRMLRGLLREASGSGVPESGRLAVRTRGSSVTVFPHVGQETAGAGPVRLRLDAVGMASRHRELDLQGVDGIEHPVGVVFADVEPGVFQVSLEDAQGQVAVRGAGVVSPSLEWPRRAPDQGKLTQMRELGNLASGVQVSGAQVPHFVEIWSRCLALACLCFLAQILARRMPAGRLLAVLLLLGLVAPEVAAQEELSPLTPEMLAALQTVQQSPEFSSMDRELIKLVKMVQSRDGCLDALILHTSKDRSDSGRSFTALMKARSGDLAGAETDLRELEKAGRLKGYGLLTYGRLLELNGKDEEFLRISERVLRGISDPAQRLTLEIRRASVLLDSKRTAAEGEALLRTIAARDPGNENLAFFTGLLGALHGRSGPFLDLKARSGADARTAFYDHLMLGTINMREGRLVQAREHFSSAVDGAPLDRDRRYALERLISAHRESETLQELADAWLSRKDLLPGHLDALVAVLRELRRPEQALGLLVRIQGDQAGVALSPERQRDIISLGFECESEEAVRSTYESLVQREPGRLEWRSGLALFHLLEGRRAEARAVFLEALALLKTGPDCLRLATAARELALDEVASAACDRASKMGADSAVRAALFVAEIDYRAGRADEALERLKSVESTLQPDQPEIVLVADAYERFGRPGEAARILQVLAGKTRTSDTRMRLAWLEKSLGRPDEAQKIWRELWRTTELPARRIQAETQLLELAAASGKAADLAIDLEKLLEAGKGTVHDLRLLVKLFTRAHDSVAAIEVLREFSGALGEGRQETLKEMAGVYRYCDDYRGYEEALQELMLLDPENATDYLEELALGALERGRGVMARKVAADLVARNPDSERSHQFAAGVLAMVGLPDEAVRAYGRVLARFPDQIEIHLLWSGVRRDAGEGRQAIGSLLDLLHRADKDDLFAIGVDGLLNLTAGTPALKVALRRVRVRIAAAPEKTFLYELGADLLEEIGDPDGQIALRALQVVTGGEQRSSLLREIMEMEAGRGNGDRQVDYGRSLLALGEQMPPEVFMSLGRVMITSGDLTEAARVFARARTEGEFVEVQREVSGYYEEAGHLREAERILRQALLTRPQDVEMLMRVGHLADAGGFEDRARRDFRQALDLLLKRSPLFSGKKADASPRSSVIRMGGGIASFVFSSRGRRGGRDLYRRLGRKALVGLLATEEDSRPLLADLEGRMRALTKLLDERKEGAEKLLKNPRLARLLAVARAVAHACGAESEADRIDRWILARYPRDEVSHKEAVQIRIRRGRIDAARSLAEDLKLDWEKAFAPLVRAALLNDSGYLGKRLEAGPIEARESTSLLRVLLLMDRRDEAVQVLKATKDQGKGILPRMARELAGMAWQLGMNEACRSWHERWIDAAVEMRNPRSAGTYLESCIRSAWRLLGPADRDRVWDHLVSRADSGDEAKRRVPEEVRRRLAALLGRTEAAVPQAAEKLVGDLKSFSSIVRLIRTAPRSQHATIFQLAHERPKKLFPYAILSFLAGYDGEMSEELVEEARQAWKKALRDQAPDRLRYLARRFQSIEQHLDLAAEFVEAVLEKMPDDPSMLLAAGQIDWLGGNQDRARIRIKKGLRTFIEKTATDWVEPQVVYDLLKRLDAGGRKLLHELMAALRKEVPDSLLADLVEGRLLGAEGRLEKEEVCLRRANEKKPTQESISDALHTNLIAQGKRSQAVEVSRRFLASNPDRARWGWSQIARDLWQMGAPLQALAALEQGDPQAASTLKMAISDELGRVDQLPALLQRHFAQVRKGGGYFGGFWPDVPGLGGIATQQPPRRWGYDGVNLERFEWTVRWHVASLPGGAEELRRELRTNEEGAFSFGDEIRMAWARAHTLAAGKEAVRKELAAALAKDGSLSEVQCFLLALQHLQDPDKPVSGCEEGLEILLRRLIVTGSANDQSLKALASFFVVAGRPSRARMLTAWILKDREQNAPLATGDALMAIHELHASTFPEDQREAVRRELLSRIVATPLDTPDGVARAQLWLAGQWRLLGDAEQAGASLQLFQERFKKVVKVDQRQALLGALALHHASHGDASAFQSAVQACVKAYTRKGHLSRLFSPRSLLPEKTASAVVVDALLSEISGLAVDQDRLGRLHLDCALLLARGGNSEDSRRLLETALPMIGEPAYPRLLWIDIARLAGWEDRALSMEKQLLEREALNGRRIPRVLDAIAARDGEAAAQKLALVASRITENPAVLRRAVAEARAQGQTERVAELLAIWRELRPEDPALPKR